MRKFGNSVLFVVFVILLERFVMRVEHFIDKRRFEPMVYHCGKDENLPPGIQYGPVKRDVFIVECNISGYGSVSINGKEFRVTPGCCYFICPGDTVVHKADFVDPRKGFWCAIDGLQIGGVLKRVGISADNPFAPKAVFSEICDILREIYESSDETDPGADFRRTSCVYRILGALMRDCSAADSNSRIQKAIGFMEANYPFYISVDALAEEMGLERSYFSTLFKAKTGISPHAYLSSLRIKKAVSLMGEDNLSTAEIAEAVGLDPQNFARLFKRITGKSPRDYKRGMEEHGS